MAELKCWNCGALLTDIPQPISRHASCPDCFNELHCCRLCTHFDPSIAAGQCDEDRADPPVIKEGANFCDWFHPNAQAHRKDVNDKKVDALARLDALFGDSSDKAEGATENREATPLSKDDQAKAKLDRLFAAKDPPSHD